jgi:hypothetical protein
MGGENHEKIKSYINPNGTLQVIYFYEIINKGVHNMTIRVAGPIMLPETPDCDYPDGEELLSDKKIQDFILSFKDYNIIDYEHQFTNPDSNYFLKNIGTPNRIFTIDKNLTFIDVADTNITVPKGTAWLECDINDEVVEKEIDDKLIVAFSITVAEEEDADYFKKLYNSTLVGKSDTKRALEVHNRITQKRTLIKDIVNPAMFTVSVVKFPCVYKARFCKKSIQKIDDISEVNKMDEANKTFIDSVKESIIELRNSRKQKEEDLEVEEEEVETLNDDVEEKLESFKSELLEDQEAFKNELLEAIKELTSDKSDETDEETEEESEEEEVEEETEDESEEEEVEDESEEEEVDDETEEEKDVGETSQKSSVGKAFSKKADEIMKKRKTAQPSRKSTLKHEGGQKRMSTIHERDIIQNAVKGDGTAIKTAIKENRKIIYNTREHNLVPYYQHKGVLNSLNKAGKSVFEESFSEEETNKAILSTELFAQYVREMLTPENIFDYANYMTVYGEEAPIRRVRAKKSYTSQDGHLPANYYFDNIPEAAELKHEKDVIRPVTQRDLFTISDRQLRNNVFGDDLLDVSLATVKETFYNGVYAARILGNTGAEGQSYTDSEGNTQTVDKQFTRKDGWVQQAGVQLESGTDFDINKIIDVFDTMYYSLPEYAQEESDYVFFVPSQVRRAFYNHFIKNSRESKIDLVSEQRALYFNNIPIITSKTLNNPEFRNMLSNGDAKMMLTKPSNTLLGVGRGFGIEPERHADTSSTYYYLTLDTDAKFVKPEEAVVATIAKDDYATIPITTDGNP